MRATRSAFALFAHGVYEQVNPHTSCEMRFHMASMGETLDLLCLSYVCQRTVTED